MCLYKPTLIRKLFENLFPGLKIFEVMLFPNSDQCNEKEKETLTSLN